MTSSVYTIPPGTPFVDALAAGICAHARGNPLALAEATVLLPTRRACRSLREAFLRISDNTPMLLPTMRPIGDIDVDELLFAGEADDWEGTNESVLTIPPAISSVRRLLLLSQLVLKRGNARRNPGDPEMGVDQALSLAESLSRFLDTMQIEEIPFDTLAGIVREDLAEHWQGTLDFLSLLIEHWPRILAEEGRIDPTERRRRLLDAQAQLWQQVPPDSLVVAAGSTGSVPATARLLAAVAEAPSGLVVLPGLDCVMPEVVWEHLDATHPQYAMAQLLRRLGIDRGAVKKWVAPGISGGSLARERLLSKTLLPSEAWTAEKGTINPEALTGLHFMDSPGLGEEARAIAMALRGELERPGNRAALVTADRSLARRVATELSRWGVEVDDSAGVPLAETRLGAFLRLTAELVTERIAPVPLLAALKHPFAAAGMDPVEFKRSVRQLELCVLRGPRPRAGFVGLAAAVCQEAADIAALVMEWLAPLERAAARLSEEIAKDKAFLGHILSAHVEFVEYLATSDKQAGAERLWSGDDGETALLWLSDVMQNAAAAPEFAGSQYPAVLAELMTGVVVRPRLARHPRVHIWGPLEARLQSADLVVLGGLNEDVWPPDSKSDPWMSRQMRSDAGLSLPERRIGLSAHDFVQSASAPVAILSRSTKVDRSPTAPSRWLVKLTAVLDGADVACPAVPWNAWQAELDKPVMPRSASPPRPTPPVNTRPRILGVSGIETLIRDPYAVYARRILGLKALEDVDADPGAADRGRVVHQAINKFLHEVNDEGLPTDALKLLLDCGRREFGATLNRPGVRAFWWPQFERLAAWFVINERKRRGIARLVGKEVEGRLVLQLPAGPFVVTARADRIDQFQVGGLAIIDYKTGAVPQQQEIENSYSPQVAVEAVLAEAGSFAGIGPETVTELAFWALTGRGTGGKVHEYGSSNLRAVIEAAKRGLQELVAAYDNSEMPYLSRPRPEQGPRFSEYDHLARVQEWSAGSGL